MSFLDLLNGDHPSSSDDEDFAPGDDRASDEETSESESSAPPSPVKTSAAVKLEKATARNPRKRKLPVRKITARKKQALDAGSNGLFAGLSDYDEAEDGEFAPQEDASSSDGDHSPEEDSDDDDDDDDSASSSEVTDSAPDISPSKTTPQFLLPPNPPLIRRPQVSYPLYSPEFTAIADSRTALHASVHARSTAARTTALAARQALADVKRLRDEKKRAYDAVHEQGSAKRERLAAVFNALGDLFSGYASENANANALQVAGVANGGVGRNVQRLRPDQVGVFLETFAACARVGQNRLPHLV
ncbi:hypothetical protein HDU89_005248 [Geranomyces variabilis]|nr:hypothetical protein HDU89_005248 [Geranomyces variabilis]